MVECHLLRNIVLRSVFKDEEEAARLLLLLMERLVASTNNDLDDRVLELVREKLRGDVVAEEVIEKG